MTTPDGFNINDRTPAETSLIERWLDGTLDVDGRRDFERLSVTDSQIAEAVLCQKRIDRVLHARFRAPVEITLRLDRSFGVAETDAPIVAKSAVPPTPKRKAGNAWKIAASIVLFVFGAWLVLREIRPGTVPRQYAPVVQRDLLDVYRHSIAMHFEPDWLCESAKDFRRIVRERFGRGIGFREGFVVFPDDGVVPSSSGVRLLGVSYAWVISPRTLCLLFDSSGVHIMVFMDLLNPEFEPRVPEDSGYRLFSRALGDLMILELSPLDHPVTLEFFEVRP